MLLIATLIWGTAFVAQSEGADAIGPYAFNCIRSFIGALVLLPVIGIFDQLGITQKKPVTTEQKRLLNKGGVCCGVALFFASNLQQLGIYYGTPIGKTGFLTTCYIVLVPIIGLFLHKRCNWNIWISVMITLVGLYLLCMDGDFSVQYSDVLVLLCAVLFAVQILAVDYFSPQVDGVRLSCIQFVVCGLLGLVPTFWVDCGHSIEGIQAWIPGIMSLQAWWSLLFAGVLSSGIAYTLQILGQSGLNPTVASLLMSLESVFAVLAGWIVLKEKLTMKELTGCIIIFVAVLFAQLPFGRRKKDVQT